MAAVKAGPSPSPPLLHVRLPPTEVIGGARYAARWRELNEDAVERYNEQRRLAGTRTTVCFHCGDEFERATTDRRRWCSPECMVERRKQRRRAA